MLNALGADQCVAIPPKIDFKILDYQAKGEPFASVTVNCGFNIIGIHENVDGYKDSNKCLFGIHRIDDRRVVIYLVLREDAIFSVESSILCKGSIKIKTIKQGDNRELVSLGIPFNVSIIGFVCR